MPGRLSEPCFLLTGVQQSPPIRSGGFAIAFLDLFDLDLTRTLVHLTKLGLAFLLALPVAWDRESEERSLGLRTFPLVAMASASYVLVASAGIGDGPELARIVQGLITGIGFLGGGAIVKRGASVHGTATAAGIWSTAAMGAAVALGRLEIAVALTLANVFVLRSMRTVKDIIEDDRDANEEQKNGGAQRGL